MQTRNPLHWIAALGLALALGTPAAAAADEPNVKLYEQQLSADELAQKLFPPKMRSIVAIDQPEPEVVGFPIQFEFNSAALTPEAKPYLDEVGKMLKLEHLTSERLVIEGHTDAVGSDAYNQRLSLQRAKSVARYLNQTHGIGAERLEIRGLGESQPLPEVAPTDGRNRRVQFGAL